MFETTVIYTLGSDTTMAGHYRLNNQSFYFRTVARPNLNVTILEGSLYDNGELKEAKGYSYRPGINGEQEKLVEYELSTEGDSTVVRQIRKDKVNVHAYKGRGMMMNALGTPFLFFLPLYSNFALASNLNFLESHHLVLGQNRRFYLSRMNEGLLRMGSDVMGDFYIELDKEGKPVKIDGIGSSWNVIGTFQQQFDLDKLIRDFVRKEAESPMPPLNPPVRTNMQLGNTSIEIKYSQPSKRGRQIFGAVVPFKRIWRTGANEPTTITFSGPVEIGKQKIPAGTYSIFTIPDKDKWQFILNEKTDRWGTDYPEGFDVLRFEALPRKLKEPLEKLTISLSKEGENGEIHIGWDDVEIVVPFKEG